MNNLVKVSIKAIYLHPTCKVPVVFISDQSEQVIFPMTIDFLEAQAILIAWQNISTPRPITIDLLRNIIEEDLNSNLERVVINNIRFGAFIAKLVIKRGEVFLEYDCRPSDALALALRLTASVYISKHIVELFKPEQKNIIAMLEYLQVESEDNEDIIKF